MLDTYSLTYVESSYSNGTMYQNPGLSSADDTTHSNGSSSGVSESLDTFQDRLTGACEFFDTGKTTVQRYLDPQNPSKEEGDESGETLTIPSVLVAPPFAANLVCLPKNFPLFFLEDQDEDSEDSSVFLDDDEEEDLEEDESRQWNEEPEPPHRLLAFADAVTGDLQRHFQRNRDEEDFCDVFQDKFETIKSGRESYYADLLRVAQFGDESKVKKVRQTASKTNMSLENSTMAEHTVRNADGDVVSCCLPRSGTWNGAVGLGPFQELFDHVLKEPQVKDESNGFDSLNEFPVMMRLTSSSLSHRKMPNSFWDEPESNTIKGFSHPPTSHTLDFSDLLAGWTN